MSNERERRVRASGPPPRGRDERTTEIHVPAEPVVAVPAPPPSAVDPASEDTRIPTLAAPPGGVSSSADTLEHETLHETNVRGVLIGVVGKLHSHVLPIVAGAGTLGRAPDNTYVLDDPYLSKQAARLIGYDVHVSFECFEGAKGVEVNGKAVTEPIWLRDGDHLKLGATLFSYRTTLPDPH
jgi:hypothetical protein